MGDETADETQDEKRERVMRRLAEMLQRPPPETGAAGAVAGGGIEEAIAALGLGLSAEDTTEIAGAVREGPDPEEAAALFAAMLESFQDWKGKRDRES